MIRLQFSAEWGPLSLLVRVFGGTHYSHVDVVLPNGKLLGARLFGGVAVRPPWYERFTRAMMVDVPLDVGEANRFYDFLDAQVGKPYDLLAITAFTFNQDWRDDDKWFCSELVAAALIASGYLTQQLCVGANRIDPGRLILLLSVLTKVTDV